jgi:hypothetical protein
MKCQGRIIGLERYDLIISIAANTLKNSPVISDHLSLLSSVGPFAQPFL